MNHDITKMMCLDVYLSSLDREQYGKIKHLLKPSAAERMPLMSWDVFGAHYEKTAHHLKRESDIKELRKIASKFHWQNDFDEIFENESFEALVITDMSKKIVWVNDGFVEMTGYSKRYALNQTPEFLQGEATSERQRQDIRQKLDVNEPFTKVITNYKKDNTPYECELKVFPLYGAETTHYLALERKVG